MLAGLCHDLGNDTNQLFGWKGIYPHFTVVELSAGKRTPHISRRWWHWGSYYFLRSEVIVMSFFVTCPKKVPHPRSKVDADLNWCRTLLYFCHLQLCSMTTECWGIQILKEVVRFLLPRKSQKLEFLAERFNFFGWQQVLTPKNLSNHNRSYLLPVLKFPNFTAWLLLLTGGSICIAVDNFRSRSM